MVLAEFLVEAGRELEFEKIYGSWGTRTQLLLQSEGFIGVELKREPGAECRYKVSDFWRSHLYFWRFQSWHSVHCDELRRQLKAGGIVRQDWVLGSFYESESGPEEADLTPA